MKKRQDMKFVLLQYRKNVDVKKEELESFRKFSKLKKGQIQVINLFDRPVFPLEKLKNYDGVFFGGTSETSVFKKDQKLETSINAIHFLIKHKIPTFASCFGFQLAVVAFGGEVLHQQENFEMGTYPIYHVTPSTKDPLISCIDDPFYGVSVHKQKVVNLPKPFIGLARTKECWHVIKVKDAPFWGFQFHPEVDHKILSERLTKYAHLYTRDKDHLNEILSVIHPTDDANSLCKLFVDKLILNKL